MTREAKLVEAVACMKKLAKVDERRRLMQRVLQFAKMIL